MGCRSPLSMFIVLLFFMQNEVFYENRGTKGLPASLH
jgi:hypothetical protein